MDEKELIKKFHNKHFLKKNELAEFVAKLLGFVRNNKALVSVLVLLGLALGVGLPTLRWYRAHRVEQFNIKLFESEKSLKKIDNYQELIKNYESLPASQYARLKLVENYLEHNQPDDAIAALDEGIKKHSGPDIFSTLLVLKRIDLLKSQSKFLEAVDYATNHRNNILKTYLPQYKLLQAGLLILADKQEEARSLYQQIVAEAETTEDGQQPLQSAESPAVRQAQQQLMLLDLGVL